MKVPPFLSEVRANDRAMRRGDATGERHRTALSNKCQLMRLCARIGFNPPQNAARF